MLGDVSKYARRERERRFLLAALPNDDAVRIVRITDRYVTGTRIRVRRMVDEAGGSRYKLTQKVPDTDGRPGWITTIYLSEDEYAVFSALPAVGLTKTRHSIPPFGIDVFDPPLAGLVMAEIEFGDDVAMAKFTPPPWAVAEVTADSRFTGGSLVRASQGVLRSWLLDYGVG